METHDILIIVLIAVILIFQFRVFSQAKSKILLFKNMMPEQPSFNTIKIYVREDEIEKITLNEIFDEIDQYKSNDFEERERKRLKKKYDPFKKNTKKSKDVEINAISEESSKNTEEINKAAEGIIQSIKQNSKRNLFED